MNSMQIVHLKRTKRVRSGHLWVFSNELHENPKAYESGSLVEIRDMHEGLIGTGYINPHSLIAIRIIDNNKTNDINALIKYRISNALSYRRRYCGNAEAFRVVFSEGDYLPGLILDIYGRCAVLQLLTSGMERLRDAVTNVIDELLCPEVVVLRNDSRARTLEGLPLAKEVLKGSLDALPVIEEDEIRFEVNPLEGQKTGFFLDQRLNRIAVKQYINGGQGLDLFCYSGAWSMHCASRGAKVTAVDASDRALAMARRNAEINGLQEKILFVREDVFSFLQESAVESREKYDFIIFDPPAFVKSAQRLKEAEKAYRELNGLCMRLLKKGGILATSSCSYHLSRDLFIAMLNAAAKTEKRSLRLLEFRSQAPDHPVLLSMPETEYLKCAFLVVD